MCRISVDYDDDKREALMSNLRESGISISSITRLLYDAIAAGCPVDDVEAFLVKKRVESDPDDTMYRFDNADDAIKFLEYATR